MPVLTCTTYWSWNTWPFLVEVLPVGNISFYPKRWDNIEVRAGSIIDDFDENDFEHHWNADRLNGYESECKKHLLNIEHKNKNRYANQGKSRNDGKDDSDSDQTATDFNEDKNGLAKSRRKSIEGYLPGNRHPKATQGAPAGNEEVFQLLNNRTIVSLITSQNTVPPITVRAMYLQLSLEHMRMNSMQKFWDMQPIHTTW